MGTCHSATSRRGSSWHADGTNSDRTSATAWSTSEKKGADGDGAEHEAAGVNPGELFGVVAPRCVITVCVLALAVALVYAARDPNLHQVVVSSGAPGTRGQEIGSRAEQGIGPFDEAGAAAALGRLEQMARACTRGAAAQQVTVRVTFGPNGEAVGVRVEPRERIGEEAAACLESVFRQAHLRPFEGEPQTLNRCVQVR